MEKSSAFALGKGKEEGGDEDERGNLISVGGKDGGGRESHQPTFVPIPFLLSLPPPFLPQERRELEEIRPHLSFPFILAQPSPSFSEA